MKFIGLPPWALDQQRQRLVADALAVAMAASLPWSTSATGIFVVLWLMSLIPMISVSDLKRELATPVGGLPVLLWIVALIGVLWAVDIPVRERLGGLGSYHKLLTIPLLLAQFRRSEGGAWVMVGYLASCVLLLAVSWTLVLLGHNFPGKPTLGVPVKDYILQSAEFTVCAVMLAGLSFAAWDKAQRGLSICCLALMLLFLANVLYVSTSRTVLAVIPVLALLFGYRYLNWKGLLAASITIIVIAFVTWSYVPLVGKNLRGLIEEATNYRADGVANRATERLDFWRKSIGFINDAPVLGHGTGSITTQFRIAARGQTGVAAEVPTNPHNQVFAVGIQLGVLGTALLFALWFAHLTHFFRASGLVGAIGLAIVTQNIVGSLFNSLLFDFASGWSYAIAVGVAGGQSLLGQFGENAVHGIEPRTRLT